MGGIPFQVVDGKITDPDSGEILDWVDGAVGTITLKSGVIRLTAEPVFRPAAIETLVASGTRIYVVVEYAKSLTDALERLSIPKGKPYAVAGKVTSEVRLIFSPDSKPRLECKSVELEGFLGHFLSLNQAYTEASIRHETERRSHTGNVFRQVWVVTQEGELKSLSELRDEAVARYDLRLEGIAKLGAALRKAARDLPLSLQLPPQKILDDVLELATIFESKSINEEDRVRTKTLIRREVTQLWKQGGRAGQ